MRWADALRASKRGKATRKLLDEGDRDEPSVILHDPKFPKAPKTFHVNPPDSEYDWKRVPLREAHNYADWEPVDPREVVEELAKLA